MGPSVTDPELACAGIHVVGQPVYESDNLTKRFMSEVHIFFRSLLMRALEIDALVELWLALDAH